VIQRAKTDEQARKIVAELSRRATEVAKARTGLARVEAQRKRNRQ